MKKVTLLLIFIIISIRGYSDVILEEIFSYNATKLDQVTNWTMSGSITKGEGRLIEDLPLTYSKNGKEYILSGVGKTINNNYQAGDKYIAHRRFPKVNSGNIYLSFLYKAPEQSQSQSEIIGLSDKESDSGVKAWAGKQGSSKDPFRLGMTRGGTSSGDIIWGDMSFKAEEVYLIVVKYNFESQTASLFVNPELASSNEAEPIIIDDSGQKAKTELSYLMFKHTGSSIANFQISGVRVCTTWEEAVAEKRNLTSLTPPTTTQATDINRESFVANWQSVENAVGYDVNVYSGTELIKSYYTEQTSQEIEGLWVETNYIYKVIAKGDRENYSDSEESQPSEIVTTLQGLAEIKTNFNDNSWGEIATELPATSEYPTSYINDFYLSSAIVRDGSTTGPKGERHINRIAVDKKDWNGMVITPAIQSCKQIEIHSTHGSANRDYTVKVSYDGIDWETIGTYNNPVNGIVTIHTIPFESEIPVKVRIENATTSTLYIYQIIVRTTAPIDLEIPQVEDANGIASNEFIANWQSVENATGYRVVIYKGNVLHKIITAEDNKVIIDSLEEDEEYAYTVSAIGDGGINFLDSYLSEQIEVKTNSKIKAIDLYSNGYWETICLPYNLATITDADENDIENYSLKEFTGVTNEEERKLIFSDIPKIEAGKPYLLSMPKEEAEKKRYYLHMDTEEEEVTSPIPVTYENYTFQGTFEKIQEGNAENLYAFNNEETYFVKGVATTEIPENHAYFILPSGANAEKLQVEFNYKPDLVKNNENNYFNAFSQNGILYIITNQNELVNIYTLEGKLLHKIYAKEGTNVISDIQKGVYFINSKKVIIK